jgi:hypothetical protein
MRNPVGALLLIPASLLGQTQTHTLRGQEVALYNIAGTLRVEGGTGDAVRVEVTREGPDASRLRVEAGSIRGRETLRVIYPGDRVVYRETSQRRSWGSRSITRLRVDDDGTFDGSWDGGRGSRVDVVRDGSGIDAHANIRVIVPPGKSVDLNLAVGDATVSNVEGDVSVRVHTANLTTTRTKGRLNLDTGSGEVNVTDAEGDVTLDSGSGSVTVSGVRGRELTMDTGSGEVRASTVEVEVLGLDTGSGGVTLRGVKARDLSVDTGSGSVEIELLSDVERMGVDSGSGGITIGVPSALGAELDIETGSGGIDVDIPITLRRTARRHLTGSIGDGKGRMVIETGSGSIRLRAVR